LRLQSLTSWQMLTLLVSSHGFGDVASFAYVSLTMPGFLLEDWELGSQRTHSLILKDFSIFLSSRIMLEYGWKIWERSIYSVFSWAWLSLPIWHLFLFHSEETLRRVSSILQWMMKLLFPGENVILESFCFRELLRLSCAFAHSFLSWHPWFYWRSNIRYPGSGKFCLFVKRVRRVSKKIILACISKVGLSFV
jgi:hypothetical protein